MELFDVCDEYGHPTGATAERRTAHAQGICHRTAHVWITRRFEGRNQVLVQKRALNKDSFPGQYDTSAAGHIQAGDEPKESALRELEEELGIPADPDDLTFVGTFRILYQTEFYGKVFKDNEVAFVYIYRKDVNIDNLILQTEEVDSVRWFDLEEVIEAISGVRDKRFCVPSGGISMIRDYLVRTEWKVLRIQEGDYGCEERMDGEKAKVLVTLINGLGEEKRVLAEDERLYELGIDEGSIWPENGILGEAV